MRHFLFVAIAVFVTSVMSFADDSVADTWRYSLTPPADGWQNLGFDDSPWTEAAGGFGTRGTPGSRIGTEWKSSDIWLRKSFDIKAVPAKPALLIHHDDEAEVFINGETIIELLVAVE